MSVAVIGAGNWGKNLVKTFHALGALAGVVEADTSKHEALKREFPEVPLWTDINKIFENKIQAVAIATPVPTHFEVAKTCLNQGCDVFVEKPLTLSTRDAEVLHAEALKLGRILMVGHLLLYQPAIRWIHSFLREGGIGELLSLHQERLNLGKARNVENALWSLGVHDVAVMLSLVDSTPKQIQTQGQSVLTPTVEDDVYLHIKFENGVQAHLHNSWLWPVRKRELTLVGTKGMLVFDELAGTVTLHRKTINSALQNCDSGSEVVFQGSGEPLKLELEHFLQRIQDRNAPLSDGKNGVAVIRVLEEASLKLKGHS